MATSALGAVSTPLALPVNCGAVDLSLGSNARFAGIVGALTVRDTGSTVGGTAAGLGVGLAVRVDERFLQDDRVARLAEQPRRAA